MSLSSDPRNCCNKGFSPLGNSDHVISISLDFPSNSKDDSHFHLTSFDYSRADWDGLLDLLRDVP